MATLDQVLQTATSIEEAAGRIYDQLALRFEDDPHWHPLFKRLADEERGHAGRIRRLQAHVQEDALKSETHGLNGARLEALLALAKDIERMLRDDPRGLSLRAAVASTYRLEDKMAAVHADVLAAEVDPETREVFEQLACEDRAHAELFGDVAQG